MTNFIVEGIDEDGKRYTVLMEFEGHEQANDWSETQNRKRKYTVLGIEEIKI